MVIIKETTEFRLPAHSAVAVGKFDGVHRGHRKLLEAIREAKTKGMRAVVFTFDPPPNVFFSKEPVKELTTKEEKRQLFKEAGVDILIEFPLNHSTAATPPVEFITDILVSKLNVSLIAAGEDVSYGDHGRGDCALLKQYAASCGYEVRIVDKVCVEDREISSTRIREELEAGNLELVRQMLGAPYSVTGIIHKETGRYCLLPPEEKLLPPDGCYGATARQDMMRPEVKETGQKWSGTVCVEKGRLYLQSEFHETWSGLVTVQFL